LFEETGFIHPAGRCFAPFPKRSDMLFWGQKSMQKTLRLLMLLWKNYGGGKPAAIQTRP